MSKWNNKWIYTYEILLVLRKVGVRLCVFVRVVKQKMWMKVFSVKIVV